MPIGRGEVRYATDEVARVGDRVNNDGWYSIVDDVIATPEQEASWDVSEPRLMLRCREAGLVFEPCSSVSWEAIVFQGRSGGE
jgi:hypothetical protein